MIKDVDYPDFVEQHPLPGYFNPVPAKGFELVSTGDGVPSERFDVGGISLTAKPRPEDRVGGAMLLLPKGRSQKSVNVFHEFFNAGRPLFSIFVDLDSTDAILAFADQHGQLRPGVALNLSANCVFLESLALWEKEIRFMRGIIEAWSALEAGREYERYLAPRESQVHLRVGDQIIASVERDMSESKAQTLHRLLWEAIDQRTWECDYTIVHSWEEDGRVRSRSVARDLLSALWLQLSQSFFRDGEKDVMAHRCCLTGKYFARRDMSKRKEAPHKGELYAKESKRKFDQQKRARVLALEQGRTVKEDRKGRTEFLVGFDEIGDSVEVILARRREGIRERGRPKKAPRS